MDTDCFRIGMTRSEKKIVFGALFLCAPLLFMACNDPMFPKIRWEVPLESASMITCILKTEQSTPKEKTPRTTVHGNDYPHRIRRCHTIRTAVPIPAFTSRNSPRTTQSSTRSALDLKTNREKRSHQRSYSTFQRIRLHGIICTHGRTTKTTRSTSFAPMRPKQHIEKRTYVSAAASMSFPWSQKITSAARSAVY